jgi:hypothetical protein
VTIVAGHYYSITATVTVTNGSPGRLITSNSTDSSSGLVQTVINPLVSGATYTFLATAGATHVGIEATYGSGTMQSVVSNVSILDLGLPFRGYLTSRAFTGDVWPRNKNVIRSYLLASASSGTTITQGWIRNFGDETSRTDTVSLTAVGSETNVIRRFESPELQDAPVFQVTIGDAAAAPTAFVFERWWAQADEQELL